MKAKKKKKNDPVKNVLYLPVIFAPSKYSYFTYRSDKLEVEISFWKTSKIRDLGSLSLLPMVDFMI